MSDRLKNTGDIVFGSREGLGANRGIDMDSPQPSQTRW